MAIYTIHSQGEGLEAIDDARFLRDGFSWRAFWLGPLWLLRHGLYAAFMLWVVAVLLLLSLALMADLSADAAVTILVALQALLGLEADHLLQAKLARKGYRLVDIVAAPNPDEAEVAFYRRHASASDENSGRVPTPPEAGL